MRRKLWRKFC